MKHLIYFTLMLTVSIPIIANAKAERSTVCEPREPAIEYNQAIEIAKKSLRVYLSVQDTFFIDLVELQCQKHENVWIIGFRRKKYESGHLLIYVHMDGNTKITVVKDK